MMQLNKEELLQDLLKPTSWGKRLGGYILDYIIFYVIMIVLFGIIGAILGFLFGFSEDEINTFTNDSSYDVMVTIIFTLSYPIYYIIFEVTTGRTPAKMMLKLRLVTNEGQKPTFTQLLQRNFTRLVPFEALSFISNVHGLHDRWSDTMVIDDSDLFNQLSHKSSVEDEDTY